MTGAKADKDLKDQMKSMAFTSMIWPVMLMMPVVM
jgi:hypothetical protein